MENEIFTKGKYVGMNYYCISKPCPWCHESKDKKHIGKSSCGWTFLFESYYLEGPTTYKEWIEELSQPHKLIINEENETVPLEFLIDLINKNDRNKKMLSSPRMALGLNLNEKEKIYLEDDRRREIYQYINDSYFIDEDGYGFSRHSFS